MEEKLRSISKRIHWSLLLRAALFGLAWLFLPFWLFFLVALYLYFVPLFQAGKLAVPFFSLILLSYLQSPEPFFALVFAAIFYLILIIKDLLILDRRSAYEILVLALVFLFLRGFFMAFNEGIGGVALLYAFLAAAIATLLLQSFLRTFGDEARAGRGARRAAILLSFLLFVQVIVAGLFLPLDFIYQSAIVFLVIAFVTDLVAEHLLAGSSRNKILGVAMTLFAFLIIILSSARWGL